MELSVRTAGWDAIFFDVDGVLIDSMHVKGEAFADSFPEVPHMRAKILEHHLSHGGVNRVQKLADIHLLVMGRAPSPDELDDRVRAFAAHVEDRVACAPEMPGVGAALDYLTGVLPLHAVSATPSDELQRIMRRRQMTRYFRSISGWPPEKSQLVSTILVRDGLAPSRCVLVGDSRQDLEAAQRSGVHFVQMARTTGDAFVSSPRVITNLGDLGAMLSASPGASTGSFIHASEHQ